MLARQTKPNGNLMKTEPKIKRIAVLAKFDDDKIRQIIISENQEGMVLNLLVQLSENNTINVMEKSLEGITLGEVQK